jgi:putative membrane protein
MLLFLIQACQERAGKNYNTVSDENGTVFIKNGIEGGLTEIKASGLAITNSNNQRVIALAKMMINDHSAARDTLKKIEMDKKVDEKDTINAAHLQMIDDLSKKSGEAFDKSYLQMMVADHEDAVKLFNNASQNRDKEISKFAASTLPIIQMHLDSANAILSSVK